MTSKEIKELCVNSSQTYYKYLEENGLGRYEVEVYSKEPVVQFDRIYKLKLSKKLFDLDTIVFTDRTSNQQYDTISQIKIIEYDIDQNFLIIQVPTGSGFSIESLDYKDIVIITDLKFLVLRVLDWFQKNGELIGLPTEKQTINTEINFCAEQPNPEQKDAMKNILTSPFSYIWGPPGTGKTQLVLSYVITKYIEEGKKIAIFAPTNNAIEQVLRGVINKTNKAGINSTQIIRLGNPSKAFAEQFPEVCEAKGVMKKISEIDNQIEIIKKLLESENLEKEYTKIKNVITQFQKLDSDVAEKEEIKERIKKGKQELNLVRTKLKNASDSMQRDLDILGISHNRIKAEIDKLIFEKQRLEIKMKSFFHSIKKIFLSSTLSKEESRLSDILPMISSKQTELFVLNKKNEAKNYENQNELHLLTIEVQKSENSQSSLNMKLKDNSLIETTLNFIKKEVDFNIDASKFISDLDINNRNQKKVQLIEICQKLGSELLVRKSIAEDYSRLPYKKLYEIMNELEIKKEFMKSQTTEERLKGVNIVGCTLDYYISKFVDNELPVSHFFLDEAGYACVIKALTMFRSGKPVTFLGDHLQLPPVCELNDDKLMAKEEYKDVFIWSQSAIFVGDIFTKSKENALQDYLKNNEPNFDQVIKKSDLKLTHRFGENLAKVLNQFVYKNGFASAPNNETTKIKFIHVTNNIPPTARRVNYGEAKAIQDLIKLGEYDIDDLVILTPYKSQIVEIGKLLPKQFKEENKILSVHGSQGREWKTVILSVSDTSDMWFTDSECKASKGLNLINTAVSRAREELIIVCNHNYWIARNGQLIQGLLKVATRIEI